MIEQIRNFSIIAHIDHGKSTLADRMLELTHTVPRRKMRDQVLDKMELERERGITIKMQPVRMKYMHSNGSGPKQEFILNLIDTPGHIDFSYEVSRALTAVEGAILLVDSTQGVQAQTLTTLAMARDAGLVIVPAISKIDSPRARRQEIKQEIVNLLDCSLSEIIETSGKTGAGVEELLAAVVARIPAPKTSAQTDDFRGLVFDFEYSNHRGVIVYIRVYDGTLTKGESLEFRAAGKKFSSLEVGFFMPDEQPTETLVKGEIGYIVTGIKEPGIASVGDTITKTKSTLDSLPGYMSPQPVVWSSFFPESQDDFTLLRQSLSRLKLSDSALSFEEESSAVLGRGFRCGFLGMLHLEIIAERLKREFNLSLINTVPSISYTVRYNDGKEEITYSPSRFPDHGTFASISEPWVDVAIITPPEYSGSVMQLLYDHEAKIGKSEIFGDDRLKIAASMPLRELMRSFFDRLKSVSSGFASLSYEVGGMRDAEVTRLDVLVAEEIVPAFSRVVSTRRVQTEAEQVVERLRTILPRQLFATKIQARALGRILSSKTLSALRKDVTGDLYGGDVTRKRKLLEKQKKGKKRLKARGKITIPHDVFMKMVRSD